MGIIEHSADVELLALHVPDNGGISFVPAFSGLFAPYWRSDARGAIVGLSRFNTKDHLARATLESICHQSVDVVEAMVADAGLELTELKVDGGVTLNNLCMQIQADLLGIDVVRPKVNETTALGAAYAAGLAVGFWKDTDALAANWAEGARWSPTIAADERRTAREQWAKAVERTYGWV
jgi:glycerol kinase